MKSYIPLETAAIFFLANPFLKQGICSKYVMVDLYSLTEKSPQKHTLKIHIVDIYNWQW